MGDLHGQFYDLLQLLSPEVGGEPPDSSFVFLGDFVDRGHNSVETLSMLLCLKLKFPGHITLLRGNHEVSADDVDVTRCCVSLYRMRFSYTLNSLFPFLHSKHCNQNATE